MESGSRSGSVHWTFWGLAGLCLLTWAFPGNLNLAQETPITGGCAGGALGAAHDRPGVLCEDFDTDRNGSGSIEWIRLFPAAIPCDPFRALSDTSDDILGHSAHGGTIPLGVSGRQCVTLGMAADVGCGVLWSENDWHLHSAHEGCDLDDSYDLGDPNFASACAPAPRAHSGLRSLHLGRHLRPSDPNGDTYRFRQTSAFVLDPIRLGASSTLEFWHIIQTCDDLCISLPPASATAGGQVHISTRDPALGVFQPWERLMVDENGYGALTQDSVSVCEFDPRDDLLPPKNETMCAGDSPLWSSQGDHLGTDPTCTVDTDGNDPNNLDCGRTTHRTFDPTCSWVTDPSCGSHLENGSTGNGVWARSRVDLSPFSGRDARLRWIFMGGGGWGFGFSRSFLEPEPGFSPYGAFSLDDGWYVDDIRITDVVDLEPVCVDGDGDGFGFPGNPVCPQGPLPDCQCLIPTAYPGAPEICDQVDNDCDGIYFPNEIDEDLDGVAPCQGDCNDEDPGSIGTPSPISDLDPYIYNGEFRFLWGGQRSTAGSSVTYDIWTGLLSDLRNPGEFGDGWCESDNRGARWYEPPATDPPPGDGRYFIIRGQSGCPDGDGSWGTALRDAQVGASAGSCD